MPLAGAFLLLQGVVEIVRCILCIRRANGRRANMTSRKSTSRNSRKWCT
jgi:TRAP-type mannitol/chloroaromatic compound transport system permease small subunit